MSRIPGNIEWSADADQVIRDNVGRVSYSEIAKLLGSVSRSAVIGRASRLGLSGTNERPVISKGTRSTTTPRATITFGAAVVRRTASPLKKVVPREPEFTPLAGLVCQPVSLFDREEHQCNWPLDGGMYCGLQRMESHSEPRTGRRVAPTYCPSHHHASITPSKYQRGI